MVHAESHLRADRQRKWERTAYGTRAEGYKKHCWINCLSAGKGLDREVQVGVGSCEVERDWINVAAKCLAVLVVVVVVRRSRAAAARVMNKADHT